MKIRQMMTVVLSSFLGGAAALAIYTSFFKPEPVVVNTNNSKNDNISLTSNSKYNTADFVVPDGLNFVMAAKNATPSVVHIKTTYGGNYHSGATNMQDLFRQYFGESYGQRRAPRAAKGAGSGVIISKDGHIVTNNHVVQKATEIEVVLNDNRSYPAKVIGVDKSTDLAVIKVDAKDLPSIKYGDSDKINIGEWVLAIGNPFEFRSTVTAGIISAKGRNINILDDAYRIESFIQTDAAVNPGNSGGALVNLKGNLVGINTAIASPSGAFAGYSFAVPVTLVKKVVSDLIEYGAVQRALLGISIANVDADIAKKFDLDVVNGVFVTGIYQNGAANDAGLEKGDVIIAIEETPVKNVSKLQELVAVHRPGDKVKIKFLRKGKERLTSAKLKNANGTVSLIKKSEDALKHNGATFVELPAEAKKKLSLNGGVQINKLDNGKWREAGIKSGFIITKIDRRNITNLNDLRANLMRNSGDGVLVEGIYPNGQKAYYGLGW